MIKVFLSFLFGSVLFLLMSCSDNSSNLPNVQNPTADTSVKITFVELGSETCIPCKKMRPVMDSIQQKYGNQIFIKFIDALKNSSEAEPYKIRVMPTQVFLDSNDTEIHRHEGFYPEDSIHVLLQSKGLKIISN